MSNQYGNFRELRTGEGIEHLSLSFKPNSVPIKQRWRNNGLSADFLGDYLTIFFPTDENETGSIPRHSEAKNVVSYIANELLENAMKYTGAEVTAANRIILILRDTEIVFYATNCIDEEQSTKFKLFIEELLANDPNELYLQKLEANAVSNNDSTSGLGFLTMINDYHAEIAWNFDRHSDTNISVTTQVVIKI